MSEFFIIIIFAAMFLTSAFFLLLPKIKQMFSTSSKNKKTGKNKKKKVSKAARQGRPYVRDSVEQKNEQKEEIFNNAIDLEKKPEVNEDTDILLSPENFEDKPDFYSLQPSSLRLKENNPYTSIDSMRVSPLRDIKNEFEDIKQFLNIPQSKDNVSNVFLSDSVKDFYKPEEIKNISRKIETEPDFGNEDFKSPVFFDKPNLNYDKDDYVNFEEENIDLNKLPPQMKKLIISNILKRISDE